MAPVQVDPGPTPPFQVDPGLYVFGFFLWEKTCSEGLLENFARDFFLECISSDFFGRKKRYFLGWHPHQPRTCSECYDWFMFASKFRGIFCCYLLKVNFHFLVVRLLGPLMRPPYAMSSWPGLKFSGAGGVLLPYWMWGFEFLNQEVWVSQPTRFKTNKMYSEKTNLKLKVYFPLILAIQNYEMTSQISSQFWYVLRLWILNKFIIDAQNRHVWSYMGVSKNRGTPKSSILIGFSMIFTIHFGGKIPLFLG